MQEAWLTAVVTHVEQAELHSRHLVFLEVAIQPFF